MGHGLNDGAGTYEAGVTEWQSMLQLRFCSEGTIGLEF